MYRKKRTAIITTIFFCILLLANQVTLAVETQDNNKADALFAAIVDFAVSRDYVLAAQEDVIQMVRKLDEHKPRNLQIPEYAQSTLLEAELLSAKEMQSAQQIYAQLKRELISALSRDISTLLNLQNQIQYQRELKDLLEERIESVERQVQAGLIEPASLWQLSESIIDIRTTIADAKDKKSILRREIAFNYGNEDWRELLKLIKELEELEVLD